MNTSRMPKACVTWRSSTSSPRPAHWPSAFICTPKRNRSNPHVLVLAETSISCYALTLNCHFCRRRFQLAPDDAWRCPHCKQLQQGSIKLSLWTLPDILILHLKRFRQVLLAVLQVCRKWSSRDSIISNAPTSGWRSTNEDSEHGEVPSHRHGHGTTHGEEEPEQLEPPFSLVAMETALRNEPRPRGLPLWPVCSVQSPWDHARRTLHR